MPSTHSTNYAKRKHMANILQKDKLPCFIAVAHYLDRPNSKWSFQQVMAVKACVEQGNCMRTILLIPHLLKLVHCLSEYMENNTTSKNFAAALFVLSKTVFESHWEKKKAKILTKGNVMLIQSQRYLHFCGAIGTDGGVKRN